MFVERKVCYSALFSNLVEWHASVVSFPLSDVILAQLAYPWVTSCFDYVLGELTYLSTNIGVNYISSIVIDNSRVILQFVLSLTLDSRGVIYNPNMFIVQTTVTLLQNSVFPTDWHNKLMCLFLARLFCDVNTHITTTFGLTTICETIKWDTWHIGTWAVVTTIAFIRNLLMRTIS